jgi:hypothetical protein
VSGCRNIELLFPAVVVDDEEGSLEEVVSF